MYLKSLLKYSKDVFSLLPTSKTNDVKCRWVRLHCSQSEMSHQRCFSVSETCLYKVYPFFMTSYWSKSKKTVQNLSFWLVDIIFSKKKSGLCVFVAMHCILVYLTCMFLLNLSGFTPTIYVKKGGLDRPLCYFIAYHRYKNQTDTFSGLTPVLPWLRPTHLRATAVTTHPLKSPSARKLFFPSSAATQKKCTLITKPGLLVNISFFTLAFCWDLSTYSLNTVHSLS